MDIVYARGEASISDVLAAMPDAPARGALGRLMTILVDKGHLKHRAKGREYMYKPTVPVRKAGPSAMRRVVDTFYGGSLRQAVAAHLAQKSTDISDDELKHLAELIRQARNKGR